MSMGSATFIFRTASCRCAAFTQQPAPGERTQASRLQIDYSGRGAAAAWIKRFQRARKQRRHVCMSQMKPGIIRLRKARSRGGPESLRHKARCHGVGVIQQAANGGPAESGHRFRRGIFHAASDTAQTMPCHEPGDLGLAAEFPDDGCCRIHAISFLIFRNQSQLISENRNCFLF